MKLKQRLAYIVLGVLLFTSIVACSKDSQEPATKRQGQSKPQKQISSDSETKTKQADQSERKNTLTGNLGQQQTQGSNSYTRLREIQVPIWKLEDVAKEMEPARTRSTMLTEPLPFYQGEKPLNFETRTEVVGMGLDTVLYHDFRHLNFRNSYIYPELIERLHRNPRGARTTDLSSGRLLAEARKLSSSGQQMVEIEEFHYNDNGILIFTCKSTINSRGYKVKERDVIGTKEREYYFMWPSLAGL